MSRFDRYDRLAGKATDHVMGEPFTFTPMETAGNERPERDVTRSEGQGTGTFSRRDLGAEKTSQVRTMAQGQTPCFSADRSYFGPTPPRQGDLLWLPEQEGTFEIVRCEPDGQSRWFLVLARRGR